MLLLHSCMTVHETVVCQDTDCSSRSDVYLKRQFQPFKGDLRKQLEYWQCRLKGEGSKFRHIAAQKSNRYQQRGKYLHFSCPSAAVGLCPQFMDKSQNTVFPSTGAISAFLFVKDVIDMTSMCFHLVIIPLK